MLTAIYARTSTPDPARLTAQIERCRQACLGESTVLTDHGISGITSERPGLTRLLDACDTGRINTVLITGTDRLSRQPDELAGILDWMTDTGVLVLTVDRNGDTRRADQSVRLLAAV